MNGQKRVLTSTGITIAPWLHEDSGIASDPINLLFEVRDPGDPLQAVKVDLRAAGWNQAVGDHQFIYFDNTRLQENSQYEKNPSWLPGIPSLRHILFRYHLRLWYEPRLDKRILGGVHLEIFSFGHEIISFDEAKREIANDFLRYGWTVNHDAVDLSNDWLDSRNLSASGRVRSAIGRSRGGPLSRVMSLFPSTRDRFLGNGYATFISR